LIFGSKPNPEELKKNRFEERLGIPGISFSIFFKGYSENAMEGGIKIH